MALLNLAVNARDAMPEGGTLTISARAREVGPGHSAQAAPGHYVRLSVADTGTGMDEATLARAIEPFFSTKGIGKGTGLGLSMVHGLAAQLGGGLTIESTREGHQRRAVAADQHRAGEATAAASRRLADPGRPQDGAARGRRGARAHEHGRHAGRPRLRGGRGELGEEALRLVNSNARPTCSSPIT
jgi:signal transduction histidine kinase